MYYNRIINETNVSSTIKNFANNLKKLAERNQKLPTVEEYYNRAINSGKISESWDIIQSALAMYPGNNRLITALNEIANRNLIYGRKLQREGNINGANFYFERVLNDARIDNSIRHMSKIYSNQSIPNYRPVIYIDVGHGGSDPGAVSNGIMEKTLNLNVSRLLEKELTNRGYRVIMSRNTDKFIDLSDRPYEANGLTADLFLSVHHNSMGGSGVARGIETFIYHRVDSGFGQETNRNNFNVDDPRIAESLRLADLVQSSLINSTNMFDRGVKGNNFNV